MTPTSRWGSDETLQSSTVAETSRPGATLMPTGADGLHGDPGDREGGERLGAPRGRAVELGAQPGGVRAAGEREGHVPDAATRRGGAGAVHREVRTGEMQQRRHPSG